MKSQTITSLMHSPAGETDSGTGSGGVAGTLSSARDKVAQTARDTASKIKSSASETVAEARVEAERIARQKKEQAAEKVGGYSSSLHKSAESFEEQDPNIAWVAHQAADKLQSVAEYVRTRDFAGLRTDAENLARRHPAAFFGGLFVAGLVLGNVLKASRRREVVERGYGNGVGDWPTSTPESLGAGSEQTQTNYPGSQSVGL